MKKLYTLLFLFFFTFSFAKAQWVTIPDANFAAFLQQNYPQCMNGNQMDTTCSAIVNAISLNCSNNNISDLTGVQYFDSLEDLITNNNSLSFLPNLPVTLKTCGLSYNSFTTMPNLPNTLEILVISYNSLTNLVNLPTNLKNLYATNNSIINIPSLPNNLQIFDCSFNQLDSLPALPNSLTNLRCWSNNLTILPTLSTALIVLECDANMLNSLPSLPNSLFSISARNNLITTLPSLPSNIAGIDLAYNNLVSLPSLPNSLTQLYVQDNQLVSLPAIPSLLTHLSIYNNQITSLPYLPNSLTHLLAGNNQIDTIFNLPNSIQYLYLEDNNLLSLPNIPTSIYIFRCYNNQLTFLPQLPDSMFQLYIYDNPQLTCLPRLGMISDFRFSNTSIQCIPNISNILNSIPQISTLPICNLFDNNDCPFYWNISGKTYFDANNNCIDDVGEQGLSNLKLQLLQNGNLIQQVYSGSEGLYSFDTDTGTFTYTVDTTDLPVYVTCPITGFHTSVLTPLDSLDYNMDFAMQCKPGFDVGVKNIARTSGQFFPGNIATIKIGAGDMASFYGLTCASGISGSVIVDFTGPITFISEAPGALVPSVVGNILTYTIPDFGLVNFNSDFRIIVQTDTTAQASDQVCFTVNIIPTTGDNNVSNNSMQHCFSVVNSFDPNAKEVYPEGGIPLNQEWLTYTIHFQNTGNAPAQNIYILDTLNQNLIPETFTLLSYSHEPLTQLFGNVVKFNFPNINLPDSTNDEPNSHGFVQYKIKLTPGLPIGTTISNIAYNFFDFNPPVATNSVSNMVGVTSVANINEKMDFSVFPNPTSSEINISFNLNSSSEMEIKLYNSLGQVVKTLPKTKYEGGKHLINISVADLPLGVYHLKAIINNQTIMRKIIKY